ncbi:hypothetical protein NLU13_3457 [Sarocladium strictum]|uniref:Asparaginase family protein n=1 Tax=Sarocladium strictum TaxID=5046 RepID=A0AA39LAG4_SARSR|nr:hypothetical protein NLU13_3457 [Sarocladium strictum]
MNNGRHDHTADRNMTDATYSTDGALGRLLRLGHKPKQVPAIFIHAGAGFHSHQNEHVHLKACVAAAEMGMRFLKAGATATEAVEASLRVLEDKEITNAGYGSNLSIDGTVECDATIVDHLGRSGACGATPNVRNPISLAKLILDTSNQPLSLRRVPPNALVGEGARMFAEENGMATFDNEYLISKNARDRFLRWQEDLKRADARSKEDKGDFLAVQPGVNNDPCQYDTVPTPDPTRTFPRDNAAALMAGTWNEGQPDSPYTGTPAETPENVTMPGYFRPITSALSSTSRAPIRAAMDQTAPGTMSTPSGKETPSARLRAHARHIGYSGSGLGKHIPSGRHEPRPRSAKPYEGNRDGSSSPRRSAGGSEREEDSRSPAILAGFKRRRLGHDWSDEDYTSRERMDPTPLDEDHITDTVGAIAIDNKGHIAAASSSGGIGMKHRGRLGPAALVGIGTAVVPCAPGDETGTTVAAVTSGTGEHMATTMASQRCAERVYHGTRKTSDGLDVRDDDEDAILESFVVNDFMGHPGVKNCHSTGAIGVMVVKKTNSGYYFQFAHNTDSFALASMGGREIQATCVMSRMPKGCKIAKGGRKIRLG